MVGDDVEAEWDGRDGDEYDPDPDCADEEPEGCCLGTDCCNPHLYHLAYECFDAEMAEAAMGPGPEPPVSIAHGHEGSCEACTLRIDAGERVHKYADDVVVHERCPRSGERARA